MSNTFIEEDSYIDYAILDKQTVVKKGVHLVGNKRIPFITQKEQIVNEFKALRILLIASESYPFIKTGGLADVIGSLSRNLVRSGVDTTVIIPLYKKIKDTFTESIKRLHSRIVNYNGERYRTVLFTYTYKKVKYYFIESFDFFDTERVYGYENDGDRFAFFNKAAVELLEELPRFDMIHLNDWHTGLVPLLLEQSVFKGTKTLMTIHNIDYQGTFKKDILEKVGITDYVHREDTLTFLELGINTASKISTVSPTYKEELKYEYFGRNLTGSIISRERDFYGVLNGISSSFNPTTDKLIYRNYSLETFELKKQNKTFLQETMQLPINEDAFVIGMVSRIVEPKGFDLVLHVIEELLEDKNTQFVLLGNGEKRYHEAVTLLQERHPNQVKVNLGYDATVPNYIYSGADVFLMPSRVEPCGLGQMIALKYGTLPIVRNTGGLSDSVTRYDPLTKKGNGFVFDNYNANEMKQVIKTAANLYHFEQEVWMKLVKRAMTADNSILKAAKKYIELYKIIIEN